MPVAALSIGEVWDLDVIRRWNGSGLRRGAGRPSPGNTAISLGRRFALGPQIGGGGFAVVYGAQDLAAPIGTQVAVKVLRQAHALDPEIVTRFWRELQLMSQLSHPNVMPVLAAGTDETLGLWYAMPLALGSLDDDLGTRMGEDAIVAVMRDVCAGLAYIHDKGILHRDLKPPNVLRTQYGTWAIADFGLARAVAETSIRLTSTAEAMGTAFYTAPEQWQDAKHVTETADIYSAGKIAQAMLVAGLPAGDNVPAGRLAPVIRRAISHGPQHRHQTAAELLTAIETAVAAVTPGGRWETSAEKSARLRQRLAVLPDVETVREIIRWADQAEPGEMSDFAQAFSAMPVEAVQAWWQQGPDSFTHAFQIFATGLEGGFVFEMCDPLADFARLVVTVTRDQVILREAIRGLALLGYNHNRWHVRDVAVEILQGIRDDTDAVSALEGLRMAGPRATEWTAGNAVIGTFHPTLRAGISQIYEQPQ